jgi:prevent-host-death family protein
MEEICVSASEFRVHLKDYANAVADGEQRVIMARHGYRMVALVSQEDLAFLRKHRPGPDVAARRAAGIPDILEHPENMPFEEVERIYKATKGTTSDYIERWRGKAYLLISLRTGKPPADLPWTLPSDVERPPVPTTPSPDSEAPS